MWFVLCAYLKWRRMSHALECNIFSTENHSNYSTSRLIIIFSFFFIIFHPHRCRRWDSSVTPSMGDADGTALCIFNQLCAAVFENIICNNIAAFQRVKYLERILCWTVLIDIWLRERTLPKSNYGTNAAPCLLWLNWHLRWNCFWCSQNPRLQSTEKIADINGLRLFTFQIRWKRIVESREWVNSEGALSGCGTC